jgi:hypothetical protein
MYRCIQDASQAACRGFSSLLGDSQGHAHTLDVTAAWPLHDLPRVCCVTCCKTCCVACTGSVSALPFWRSLP